MVLIKNEQKGGSVYSSAAPHVKRIWRILWPPMQISSNAVDPWILSIAQFQIHLQKYIKKAKRKTVSALLQLLKQN